MYLYTRWYKFKCRDKYHKNIQIKFYKPLYFKASEIPAYFQYKEFETKRYFTSRIPSPEEQEENRNRYPWLVHRAMNTESQFPKCVQMQKRGYRRFYNSNQSDQIGVELAIHSEFSLSLSFKPRAISFLRQHFSLMPVPLCPWEKLLILGCRNFP